METCNVRSVRALHKDKQGIAKTIVVEPTLHVEIATEGFGVVDVADRLFELGQDIGRCTLSFGGRCSRILCWFVFWNRHRLLIAGQPYLTGAVLCCQCVSVWDLRSALLSLLPL